MFPLLAFGGRIACTNNLHYRPLNLKFVSVVLCIWGASQVVGCQYPISNQDIAHIEVGYDSIVILAYQWVNGDARPIVLSCISVNVASMSRSSSLQAYNISLYPKYRLHAFQPLLATCPEDMAPTATSDASSPLEASPSVARMATTAVPNLRAAKARKAVQHVHDAQQPRNNRERGCGLMKMM